MDMNWSYGYNDYDKERYISLEAPLKMDEKFAAWENNDLNDAELTYYLEVNSRVVQKLLETAQ